MKVEHNSKEIKILDYVRRYHMVTTAQAKDLINASESTVRRMFIKLQQQGYVERVFGGIKETRQIDTYSYQETLIKNVDQKKEIGEVAADLVRSNEFVYIDCGTTTRQMAKALVKRLETGEIHNILIVTNSIINLEILAPYCEIIIIGGRYSYDRKDVSGDMSESFLKQFHFHKCFLGTDGFSFKQGFTSTVTAVSGLGRAVSKLSEQSYVLMDSSKIGESAVGISCRMENVNGIITDSEIKEEDLRKFAEMKMRVLTQEMKGAEYD